MKAADTARQTFTPLLAPGETIRTVGYLLSGPFWAYMFFSSLFAFALKYWYAGVTEQRLLLVRLHAMGKPDMDHSYQIPLSGVQLKGNYLIATLPGAEKPTKFRLNMGMKALTGFDWREFKAAFGQ